VRTPNAGKFSFFAAPAIGGIGTAVRGVVMMRGRHRCAMREGVTKQATKDVSITEMRSVAIGNDAKA
jgi:hypothetical protein